MSEQLIAHLRQMAAWSRAGEDDEGVCTYISAYSSGDVYDLLHEAANLLSRAPVQASEARGDSLRTALGILRDLERKHHGTTECSDLVSAHTQAGPVD